MQNIIEEYYHKIQTINPQNLPPDLENAVNATLDGIENGAIKLVEKKNGEWVTNQWLKKAILLLFRMKQNEVFDNGVNKCFDKVALSFSSFSKEDFLKKNIRLVPNAIVRKGVFIDENAVIMPSFINIGASIGKRTMIDIFATVGSCAQIGSDVHISSNVVIGGVLEPLQANPVIIEDNCFIGAGSQILEGVIIQENSVIGMGVSIGQSTKIYDSINKRFLQGIIPSGSVVVSGIVKNDDREYATQAAIIIKTINAETKKKVGINELLRA